MRCWPASQGRKYNTSRACNVNFIRHIGGNNPRYCRHSLSVTGSFLAAPVGVKRKDVKERESFNDVCRVAANLRAPRMTSAVLMRAARCAAIDFFGLFGNFICRQTVRCLLYTFCTLFYFDVLMAKSLTIPIIAAAQCIL